MNVAIIHDWLTGMRGGEKCLEVFCELFPDAHLYTLLHIKGKLSPTIEAMDIRTSFVQRLPMVEKRYRNYLPLFPTAIEMFDLKGYDLVLSSSHCVAKGVIPPPDSLHVSYVYSPMRYVWDMYPHYFGPGKVGRVSGKLIPLFANYLRMWDAASSRRVDDFIAISGYVGKRIEKYYRRSSDVIYPPVDGSSFSVSGRTEDYYLIVSAFAPYKRVDLAVEAFNRLGLKLRIIGTGQDEKRLKELAGPNIEFLGWQSDEAVREHYSSCRALIFPGEEDFGIVPLEAMASGRPVVAYGAGGALETVAPLGGPSPHPTGVFFHEQTPEALAAAVKKLEDNMDRFDPDNTRAHAMGFDRAVFKKTVKDYITRRLETHQGHSPEAHRDAQKER